MGRSTALVTRNALFRLVSSTASQSSSDMRMMSVSRVMPALLTSTSMRLNVSRVAWTSRSTSAGFGDVGLHDVDLRAS